MVRHAKAPGLQLKRLPELGYLLVFTPERPRFHWLNAKAWLIFELCEDSSEEEIFADYATTWCPGERRGELRAELRAGIHELVQSGLVREVEPPSHF